MRKKTVRDFEPIQGMREMVAWIDSCGDRPLFRYGQKGEFVTLSYGDFGKMIHKEAAAFSALGLQNARVAILGKTTPEWVATYLALMVGGHVAIPMDKELDFTEVAGFLDMVDADAIVYDGELHEKLYAPVKAGSKVKLFVTVGESKTEGEGVISYADLLAKGEDDTADFPERDPNALAELLFTSGTTGTSKCVMLSERNICSTINSACETVEFYPDDTIVSILPIHHTYELACMMGGIKYGMTIGINDSLRHILRNLAEFKPTGLVLVPLIVETMYKRIMSEAEKKGKKKLLNTASVASNALRHVGIDLREKLFAEVLGAFGGRLKKIVCGGAPLDPVMVKKFESFGVQISEGYGITECSPLVAVNPYFKPKSGSVGPAVPSCTVRIDPIGGQTSHGYEEGEIQVKGENVMLGYYNNPEETEKVFTEDGWFRTGDVGYMDKDGYIYITGRLKSVIVLESGKNVFPEEIEEYLSKIEEIAECVVVGRKESQAGAVSIVAVVYPNADAFPAETSKEEMQKVIEEKVTSLNRKLPSFKVIRQVELRDEPFEKTTSRKIRRHLVK